MSLATRLLLPNPGAQVSHALTGSLTTPGAKTAFSESALELIQHIELTSAQSSIDFTSIPDTYTHLMIKFQAKGAAASNFITYQYRFNNDSGTNYTDYRMYYGRTYRGGSGESALTTGYLGAVPGGNYTYQNRGFGTLMILDYADGSKYKVTNAHIGYDTNESSSEGNFRTSQWSSNSVINRVTLFLATGNIENYSMASLYGIK